MVKIRYCITESEGKFFKRSTTMGDKGGKKNKEKSQKQSHEKQKQKDKGKADKQPKSRLLGPPSGK